MLDQMKQMKQAWDLKRKMEKIQKELGKKNITISRNGIDVDISGSQEVKDIRITDTALLSDQVRLQTELKHAFNKAITDSQAMMQKEMAVISKELNLPGMG